MKHMVFHFGLWALALALVQNLHAQPTAAGSAKLPQTVSTANDYQYQETRDLVRLVKDAAELVRARGPAAFAEFRRPGSRWHQAETYIFVLDLQGNMLVHPDPEQEGTNQLDLKDVNGKPITQGLLSAATESPGKPEGWYHYQWPVPGGLLPRWKSSYVRLVAVPSGASYVVGSGLYSDRMEKSFVVDTVMNAVAEIQQNGKAAAFELLHDPRGPFIAKDAYIFVMDQQGVELVNPAFPNLEGRNILDVKDTQGKTPMREMLKVVETNGSGWVDYLWPKPGESVSALKSTYVSKARLGQQWLVVGCGVYLPAAPKAKPTAKKMTAPELMTLVREAANVFEQRGEAAFPEFRKKGSKWFRDDTYFFVWTLAGIRLLQAAEPAGEGADVSGLKDVLGRPIGKMILEVATNSAGAGWVHYMYPEPGSIFPTWKSSYVKRVTFPSGQHRLIGCGIYNMDMNATFIEDVVNQASTLIAQQGKDAFSQLRDKTGPYIFLDTYVFVDDLDGIELVNPAQPSLEGKNLRDLSDVNGKRFVREYVRAAMENGSAWQDYYWYRPGENTPTRKYTYVRKVGCGQATFIVGSGFYPR